MNYEIFGDFEIPRKPKRNAVADTRDRRAFWSEVEAASEGLRFAVGCYVFAIRRGGGVVPWYVGKTCNQGFYKECFTSHKLVYYNEVISSSRLGTPLLYLVARTTPGGKFTGTAPAKEAEFLENLLIGRALQRNKQLKNTTQTKFLKRLHVPGLVNPAKGPPPRNASAFKAMIGA